MQEIEIKAVLRNPEAVIAKFKELGVELSAPVTQDDTVYVENPGPQDVFIKNPVFLRIRVAGDGTVFLTAKTRRAAALSAIESEMKVSSAKDAHDILTMMGLKPGTHIRKSRRTGRYQGYEICVDDVEELGLFIEMEKLTNGEDDETVQEEMFRFFDQLGISRADRVHKGYDLLMFDKQEGSAIAL